MAIAIDATSTSPSQFSSSATFSHTCSGTDRVLYVLLSGDASTLSLPPATTASYDGDDMTLVLTGDVAGTGRPIYIYRLINPNTGTGNIVLSFGTGIMNICCAVSLTGVNQTTPERTIGTHQIDNSATATTSAVASSASDLVLGFLSWNNSEDAECTEGSGVTREVSEGSGSETYAQIASKAGSSGTVSLDWTANSQHWGCAAISVQEATAASGSVNLLRGLMGD